MNTLTMLAAEIRSLDTSKRSLRSFGYVVGLVLIGIAAVVLWQHDWSPTTAVYWLGGIGGALVVLGLLVPLVLRPVYRVWMALAVVLGFVMTRVLLTTVFFFVLTPIGLLMRVFGNDPMHRALDPKIPSYWIKKAYTDASPGRLERYY